ncbi:MAG: glycosyltransferase [Rubrobacter sp.]
MRLPAPEPGLRVSVVVPAKDEEDRIGACLDALARQVRVELSAYEVLLVLDGCTDETAVVARERLARHAGLRLYLLDGPNRGVGNARKLGMDAAYRRLGSGGASRKASGGIIASTDADSVVAPDWLAAQLALFDGGAEAVGGRIELERDGEDLPPHALDWYERQGRARYERILAGQRGPGNGLPQEHWQFSGASMSVTTEVYRRIGGLTSQRCLEDEHLERELEAVGARIVRSSAVRVRTSARTSGRADLGLATDLARAASLRDSLAENREPPGLPA